MNQKNMNLTDMKLGITRCLGFGLALAGALALSACGGGASNTVDSGSGGVTTSAALTATTQDMLNFKNDLWNNIHDSAHCGNCHDAGGQGKVDFANNSSISNAYSAAYTVVDFVNPSNSKMVTKFSNGGHICWLGTDPASQKLCASALTDWITKWANDSKGASNATTVNLKAPSSQPPTPAVILPSTKPANYDSGNGGLNIYNLVTTNCVGCHVPYPTKNDTPVAPEFAITQAMEPATSTITAAQDSYNKVIGVPLIDASYPEKSRLYTRLKDDGHNCFSTSCDAAAAQMLSAIQWLLADSSVSTSSSGSDLLNSQIYSDAVNLNDDGIVASGGGRIETNQIALYTFIAGSGTKILDRSGVYPAADLYLTGTEGTDFKWLPNWGVEFNISNTSSSKAQVNKTSDSKKLQTMINATGEYSIEAWVVPANTTQTDKTIVGYSGGNDNNGNVNRNFAITQNADEYDAYNRSTNTQVATDGTPLLETTGSALVSTLQHVVVTYSPADGRKIYMNGVLNSTDPNPLPGNFSNWDTNFSLVLGNTSDLSHPWKGAVRMLAIHNRALTAQQVQENFDAGVGQKYYLLFNISDSKDTGLGAMGCKGPNGENYCFIMMQAAVFDKSSYIFSKPRFIDLNDANVPFTSSLLIKGIRIGVNGVEAANGQAYQDIDICVNGGCGDTNETDVNMIHVADSTTGVAGSGVPLSNVGTVIPLQYGPKAPSSGGPKDMIFLTFEALGSKNVEPLYDISFPDSPTPPSVNPPANGYGIMIHSFEEINATLAAITGVPRTLDNINFDNANRIDCPNGSCGTDGSYTNLIQALPSSHEPGSYVAANQMAVTQLAISYCNELVNGNGNISLQSYFPNFNFNANADFTNPATRSAIIDPLLSHLMNVEYDSGGALTASLGSMPAETAVHGYLDTLIDNSTTGLDAACVGGASNCSPAEAKNIVTATCAAAAASAPMLLK